MKDKELITAMENLALPDITQSIDKDIKKEVNKEVIDQTVDLLGGDYSVSQLLSGSGKDYSVKDIRKVSGTTCQGRKGYGITEWIY